MELKIGIAGFGARSSLHEEIIHPDAGATITAVYDVAERARRDAREALPDALVTDSLEKFLASGIDAVLVLAPDFAHVEIVIPALEAGVAVFCEKPLAIHLEDTDRILETARRTGTRLYVGHNMRHLPVVVLMRKLIDEGRIGDVKAVWCRHFVGAGGDYYFKDWHADRSKSTSLLLQKGAHDIDVIHLLAGAYSTRVSGVGSLSVYGQITDRQDRSEERMPEWKSEDNWPPLSLTGLNPVVDVEDISMVNMTLSSGVLASYQQCHFTPDYWRNYVVIGTEGRIENFGDGEGVVKLWNTRRDAYRPDADETIQIPVLADHAGHGGADRLLIREFLRFVRDGGHTMTSPVAARQAVAVGVLAAQSLRTNGSAVAVPELNPDLIAYFDNGQVELYKESVA